MVELHIQFNDDIFKLRRTVVRGKSPYFEISKNNEQEFRKVHVHEIQNFISELRINPDNQFSFVSQGKIDAIKNLKPIELCDFLEEGIGIKGLREEILQQKDNVINLRKEFQSLISKKNALNLNLELIKPKIERLEEKNKLLGIRKKFSDELLWANKDMLQKEIKEIEFSINISKKKIEEIQEKLEENEELLNSKEKKVNGIEAKINEFSIKLGELTFQKNDLIKKIQTWQKEKIITKQELDLLSEQISRNKSIFKKNTNKKESYEREINLIKKEKATIKNKINNLITQQSEINKKIKENQEFLEAYNKLKDEKDRFLRDIKEKENSIDDNQKEIKQIFQSLSDIDHKLELNKWFLDNPTDNLLRELDLELKRITAKIFEIEAEIEQQDYEKTKKIKKLKILQTALRERKIVLPPNINVLKEEISKRNLEEKIKGPIIEFLKYDDNLSYAIESVLGEKLLHSFVVQDWDTLNLLKKLKEKYQAYCNIYLIKDLKITPLQEISGEGVVGYLAALIKVMNSDSDIQKVIYSKIKNCVVVKDFHSGRQLYTKQNFKGKIVTLKGEQIISYRYVYESPYIRRLKGLLSVGTQKEQAIILEEEIKNITEKSQTQKVKQAQLDKVQAEIFRKKEAFNDLLYNFKQKERLTKKKNNLYDLIYSFEAQIQDIKNELKPLENELKELESQRDPDFFKLNERLNIIPLEISKLNEDQTKWDEKLNESLVVFEGLISSISSQKSKLVILESEFNDKQIEFQKSDKEAFQIYRNLEKVEEQFDSFEKKIEENQADKINLKKEKLELEKINLTIKLELEQLTIKDSSLIHDLSLKRQDLERINAEIGPLILKKQMEIRSIEEINRDIGRIDKQLLKYIDVDDSILIEKDHIVNGLKEISKNQKDLETDINSALKTEKKLEETYYKRFQQTIDELQQKINNKFKIANIKSYCSLSLEGDFEELGIEIKAATSKDQLKTCTALSGGQISMISISLILSLQEIKPSPLVLLDEPGMFLDEKNSEASYRMIKATIEENSIQMLMFLPRSSNTLYQLADKLIGVARVGKNEVSTIFNPKIIKSK